MNEETTTQTGKHWWRWPLMPLASLLLAAIGSIVAVTVQGVFVGFAGGIDTGGWFQLFVYPLLPALIFGYLFSGTACVVAPSRRQKTGVVMMAVMSAVLAGFVAFIWVAEVPVNEAIQTTVWSVAAVGGAVVGVWHFREDQKEAD